MVAILPEKPVPYFEGGRFHLPKACVPKIGMSNSWYIENGPMLLITRTGEDDVKIKMSPSLKDVYGEDGLPAGRICFEETPVPINFIPS